MNQLKISTRLAVAFAVMVLLLVALGAVSLVRSASQRAELTDVVGVRIPITKALGALADGVNVQATQYRNLVIFSNETILKASRDQIVEARARVAEAYQVLGRLIVSDKGKEALARMEQQRADFLKVGDQYLALIQQGQKDEAIKLLEEQLRPVQLAYRASIREQVELQSQLTITAWQRAESQAGALLRDMLIAAALAIGIPIFLAIAIIRSITRPLA